MAEALSVKDRLKQFDEAITAAQNAPQSLASIMNGNQALQAAQAAKNQYMAGNEYQLWASQNSGQNADGSYVRPEWQSMVNPDGTLQSQYILGADYKPVEMDLTGLNQFRSEATRGAGTNSAWADSQQALNALNSRNSMNSLDANLNAAAQARMDQMAAQGGLRGGASERMANSGLRDLLRGKQDVRNQLNTQNLQTRTTDEANRITQLKDLVGMDQNKANLDLNNQQTKLKIDQANISAAMGEVQNKRANELDIWKKNQEVWAANKQSEAQARAGGGGK